MIDKILYGGMYLFIGIAIVFGLFLIFREIALWYFRINEIVDLLRKQIEFQQIIANQDASRRLTEQQQMPQAPQSPPRNPLTGK